MSRRAGASSSAGRRSLPGRAPADRLHPGQGSGENTSRMPDPHPHPQPRTEIVRRWLDSLNRWDIGGFVELWDPDCEFFTLLGSQLAGVPYKGHEGLRRYCEERAQVWAELSHQTDEVREVGERIVASG